LASYIEIRTHFKKSSNEILIASPPLAGWLISSQVKKFRINKISKTLSFFIHSPN